MKTKLCPDCKIEKPLTEWNKHKKYGTQFRCKECAKKRDHEYYCKNSKRKKAKAKERTIELRNWIDSIKENLQCKCGEKRIAALSFHHKNPECKEFRIAVAAGRGWCKKRILQEIEKCEVMCANCHNHLHWLERKQKLS